MKPRLFTSLAAAATLALPSCTTAPRGDYIEQQINLIGIPVREAVPLPSDQVGITVEEWGHFERLRAKEAWEQKEADYRQNVIRTPGW